MKLIRAWLCLFLLLISAHRLPAPISEAPTTPSPAPAKPRVKPARKAPVADKPHVTSKDTKPNRAHQFDGVWQTVPRAGSSYTLVIKNDNSATLRVELTFTLSGGNRYWQDLPEQYGSAHELRNTYSFDSRESHATDSTIVVHWNPAKLVDWSPRTIPNEVMLRIAPDLFKRERREGFTLTGAQLISSDGFSYNRVR